MKAVKFWVRCTGSFHVHWQATSTQINWSRQKLNKSPSRAAERRGSWCRELRPSLHWKGFVVYCSWADCIRPHPRARQIAEAATKYEYSSLWFFCSRWSSRIQAYLPLQSRKFGSYHGQSEPQSCQWQGAIPTVTRASCNSSLGPCRHLDKMAFPHLMIIIIIWYNINIIKKIKK